MKSEYYNSTVIRAGIYLLSVISILKNKDTTGVLKSISIVGCNQVHVYSYFTLTLTSY